MDCDSLFFGTVPEPGHGTVSVYNWYEGRPIEPLVINARGHSSEVFDPMTFLFS